MRRLRLAEFVTEQDVALAMEERDALRQLHPGIRVEPTPGSHGRYDLTPDQRIGLVCLPTLVVEVRPKVPMSSVLFLVSYDCDSASWFDQYAELAHEPDLVEMLAIMLARMVQHATRRGLLNGYQSEDESLPAPRGRILFDEQIRRHAGITPPVEIRHDVFTSDIIENRLLLAALITLRRIPHRSDKTKRELSRSQRLFGAVRRVHFQSAAVPDVVFTRLNHHYQAVVTLARILLRSASLDLGGGGARGSAFLIDMNVAFEHFVRTALREALRNSYAKFPDRAPLLFLDTAKAVPLRPDLCLVADRQVVWVGDVKYKRLPAAAYQNADLYQLLAYSVALDLPGGTLIYAADAGVSAAEYVVTHNLKRLRIAALDLSVPPKRILQQIGRIADRVRLQAQTEAAQRPTTLRTLGAPY